MVSECEVEIKKGGIKKLYQLSQDKMMLQWDNNRLQVVTRDRKTHDFEFSKVSFHQNYVFDLFDKE